MTSVFEGAIRMMEHQKLRRSGTSSASLAGSEGGSGAFPSSSSAPPSPVPSASSSEGNNNSNGGEAALVAEQWIWVSDMHGFVSFFFLHLFFFLQNTKKKAQVFSFSFLSLTTAPSQIISQAAQDLDPRIARAFMNLLATHYPERLARFVIVGAPALFSALWSALKRHVCADTAAKIAFVKWDGCGEEAGRTAAELSALGLGGKLGRWLGREMRQNRDPGPARRKEYPYGRAHLTKAVVDGHDLRGTEEHVAMLEGSPGLVPGA
jgi:hypothetical protein